MVSILSYYSSSSTVPSLFKYFSSIAFSTPTFLMTSIALQMTQLDKKWSINIWNSHYHQMKPQNHHSYIVNLGQFRANHINSTLSFLYFTRAHFCSIFYSLIEDGSNKRFENNHKILVYQNFNVAKSRLSSKRSKRKVNHPSTSVQFCPPSRKMPPWIATLRNSQYHYRTMLTY